MKKIGELINNLEKKIGMDKICHFFASFALVMVIGMILEIFLGHSTSSTLALLISFGIGFLKEKMDANFNWADLKADSIGDIAGFFVYFLLGLF